MAKVILRLPKICGKKKNMYTYTYIYMYIYICIYMTLICCMYETILQLNGKALQCNWPYSQVLGVSGYRKATSFTASVHDSAAVTFCLGPRFSHVTHCA